MRLRSSRVTEGEARAPTAFASCVQATKHEKNNRRKRERGIPEVHTQGARGGVGVNTPRTHTRVATHPGKQRTRKDDLRRPARSCWTHRTNELHCEFALRGRRDAAGGERDEGVHRLPQLRGRQRLTPPRRGANDRIQSNDLFTGLQRAQILAPHGHRRLCGGLAGSLALGLSQRREHRRRVTPHERQAETLGRPEEGDDLVLVAAVGRQRSERERARLRARGVGRNARVTPRPRRRRRPRTGAATPGEPQS